MPCVDKLHKVELNLDITPGDAMPCVDELHKVGLNLDITPSD